MKYKYSLYSFAAALTVTLLLLGAGPAGAETGSARSVAMSEAHMGLAAGVDAARYNPANLGLDTYRRKEIEVVGLGLNVSNNSFSLDDYNTYTGAYLTDDDKDYLLDRIPDEGLSLAADVQASAFSFSFGSLALQVTGVGQADVNLNKDLIDLVLNGNTFGDSVMVTGSFSDAVGYVSTGVSYGLPLYTAGTRQLSVGITGKYLRGLAVEQIVELEGLAATFETGFEGEGRIVARTATGGSGYALDIGAALRLSDSYTVGARIKNVVSSITWNNDTEEHSYIFSFDTVTVSNMDEDFVVSDDTTIAIESFSTSLPSVMTVGVANTSGKLFWAVDWEQGFRRAAGSSTKPRIAVGLEWHGLGFLPLRAGFKTGGDRPSSFSTGGGLWTGPFHMDLAVVTGSGISPYSTKGINVALSTGLYF